MKTPPRLPLLQLLLWAANGPAAAVAAAPFASLMELMDQTKKVSSHQHELPQPNARPKGRRALTLQSPASQAERMLEFGTCRRRKEQNGEDPNKCSCSRPVLLWKRS